MKKNEKQKLLLMILHFSETNAADAKAIHNCLIDFISRLGLELKNLKAFTSNEASVIISAIDGIT